MTKKLTGRKAWLVTWDWAGEHAAVPEKDVVAAVLRPQTGPGMVKRIVEVLYAAREYYPTDKLDALMENPYPARFGTVRVEQPRPNGEVLVQHVPYEGQISCGHNPFLYARLVDNLRAKDRDNPDAGLEWDERPPPGVMRLE